jgi:Kdo2-lipid IVA lauroyltransferase/acyltransferase
VGGLILTVLRIVAWIYYLQPVFLRQFWGETLGVILRRARLRAKVVEQNIAIAFPDSGSEHRRARVFRAAYSHLGHLSLEILMLFGPMRRYVRRYGEIRGVEHWLEAKKQGKGVILLSSHVGNWEIMSAVGVIHGGMDLMLVTKRLKPGWLHAAIESGRTRCGVAATYEPRTLKDVLVQLKKNGTVGFVLDQYAGPPVGVRVPVFGVPVGTTTAVATIAKRTGAVVLPVVNYRVPGGKLVVEVRKPIGWEASLDSTYELAENTAHYASMVERDILLHPEQWLWIHRRFKGDLTPLREGEWAGGRARK